MTKEYSLLDVKDFHQQLEKNNDNLKKQQVLDELKKSFLEVNGNVKFVNCSPAYVNIFIFQFFSIHETHPTISKAKGDDKNLKMAWKQQLITFQKYWNKVSFKIITQYN